LRVCRVFGFYVLSLIRVIDSDFVKKILKKICREEKIE
jgi:hypothetical protein